MTHIMYIKQAQEVTFVTSTWEVLGLKLSWNTSYPDWGFSWDSSVCSGKCLSITLIRPWLLPSTSLLLHYYHPTTWCIISRVTNTIISKTKNTHILICNLLYHISGGVTKCVWICMHALSVSRAGARARTHAHTEPYTFKEILKSAEIIIIISVLNKSVDCYSLV
jgi:hypothetical protein